MFASNSAGNIAPKMIVARPAAERGECSLSPPAPSAAIPLAPTLQTCPVGKRSGLSAAAGPWILSIPGIFPTRGMSPGSHLD